MNVLRTPVTLAACSLLAVSTFAQTPDAVERARVLHSKANNPVVNVGAVVEISGEMIGDQDMKVMTSGLVLDATGLTMVAYSSIDPQRGEPKTVEAGPGMEITIDSEVTSTWLQRADGKRIEAEVVLTDPELDVALLRPTKPLDQKDRLVPAKIDDTAKSAGVLDQVMVLSRMNKAAGFAPTVRFARIEGVLESPWRSYVVSAAPGDAVFDLGGRLLGVVVGLPSDEEEGGGMGMMGMIGIGGPGTTVVLPVAQFLPLVKQAREKGKSAAGVGAKKAP